MTRHDEPAGGDVAAQAVIHYQTGTRGDWWIESGAHPGARADCLKCIVGPVTAPDEARMTDEVWRA